MSEITTPDAKPFRSCESYHAVKGVSQQLYTFEKEIKKRQAMSGAERARLYRERRKAGLTTKEKQQPMSQTERTKRYRARKAERAEALTTVHTQPEIVPIQEVFVVGKPAQKSDKEPSFNSSYNPDGLDQVRVKEEVETTVENSILDEVVARTNEAFLKTEEYFVKDEVMISDDEALVYQVLPPLVESQRTENLNLPNQDVSPVNDTINHPTENFTIHLIESEPEHKEDDNNVFYVRDSDSDSENRDGIKEAVPTIRLIPKHLMRSNRPDPRRFNVFHLQNDNDLLRKKVEVLEELVYELRKEIWNLKNTTKID